MSTPSKSPIERRLALLSNKPAGSLMVHEVYRSLQGESTFAGLPCTFVRLSVCDARCKWCDTPHAFFEGTVRDLDGILEEVERLGCELCEVTGGEPLLQPESLVLMQRLADRGHTVLLETSGAHDVAGVDSRVHIIMDLKCPDSGECDNNRWENLEALKPSDQIKLVIASRRDFDWAEEIIRSRRLDVRFELLLSAAWGKVAPAELAEWLLASGLRARMQLQMHKYVWGADTRGV